MKSADIRIRISDRDKAIIQSAAKAQEMTVAEFIRRAALRTAEKVVGDD